MEYAHQLQTFVTGGVPSYAQTFHDIKWGLNYCLQNCSGDYRLQTFFSSFSKFAVFDEAQDDLLFLLGLAFTWTILRYVLTMLFFKPFARFAQLKSQDAAKYPESAWKLLVYICTWSLSCYAIFGLPQYNHIFFEPDSIWDDYVLVRTGLPNHVQGMKLEPFIYYIYFLQMSFYVHSIYASLFMDKWRSDTPLMLLHHVLTISLIGFSYVVRYHKIGLLVLFIHDPTDVVLEFTKCNVYFKNKGGALHKVHDLVATIGFIIFAVFWYLFRLYWMPLKILHSTGYGAMVRHSQSQHLPFYFFFNGMLWLLQLMNVYWFMFIINFLVKVVTGQMDEVDDIREEEVIERASKKSSGDANGRRQLPRMKSKKAD